MSKISITLNLCTQYSWMCLILFKDKKKGPISRTSNPVLQPVPVGVYVSVNDVHRGQDGLKVKIRYYFISRRVLLLIQIKKNVYVRAFLSYVVSRTVFQTRGHNCNLMEVRQPQNEIRPRNFLQVWKTIDILLLDILPMTSVMFTFSCFEKMVFQWLFNFVLFFFS